MTSREAARRLRAAAVALYKAETTSDDAEQEIQVVLRAALAYGAAVVRQHTGTKHEVEETP